MKHISVLLHESIDGLAIKSGDIVVDGTLGGGGHTFEIIKRFGSGVKIIALDFDKDAITRAKETIGDNASDVTYRTTGFENISEVLDSLNMPSADRILLDLGLSSFQIDISGRGFSFQKDEPLLMTMKKDPQDEDLTAEYIVNNWEEESIMSILRGFGEEEHAPRIARAIVAARAQHPIDTTAQLAAIVTQALPRWRVRGARRHPATKTFQALRIAVNEEYTALEQGLAAIIARLAPSGRVAVITFQSIEDRLVKHLFRTAEASGVGRVLTKKPLLPTSEEIRANPRSRSAKLRIFEKIII
jgi:16S rRNA (cytosine1402-N4)-methyltransferase